MNAQTRGQATRCLLWLWLGPSPGAAVAETATPADCPRPELAMSRYEEDYGFLRDPACRTELWDPIKYIALVPSFDTYLSLGRRPA